MNKKTFDDYILVRINKGLKNRFIQLNEERGEKSNSEVIRRLIVQYIEEGEWMQRRRLNPQKTVQSSSWI